MKLNKTFIDILNYYATYRDILTYKNNGYLVIGSEGSARIELKVKDFFDEQLVITNLKKFTKFFSFDKNSTVSNQDIEILSEVKKNSLGLEVTQKKFIIKDKYTVILTQGSHVYFKEPKYSMEPVFDKYITKQDLSFNLSTDIYNDIIRYSSLLELDEVVISSKNKEKFTISLRKKSSVTNDNKFSVDIEKDHQHENCSIAINLDDFKMIDADEHSISFGMFYDKESKDEKPKLQPLVKTESYLNEDYTVRKVIIGVINATVE